MALRDLDLAVTRGSFVSVVGPSGSGKTTLLQCLSGLDGVDAGTVEVGGEDVHRLPDARRAERRARLMGFVFQSLNLIPVFTALENAELPLLLGGAPRKDARRAAREAPERESGLIALGGVSIGATLALVTSYDLVKGSEAFGDGDVAFAVPWAGLTLLLCGVLLASLLVALPSAVRASKTPPAAALRSVEEGGA